MFAGRPVIGVVGGIGSGKSFIAKLFGGLGCAVINSDDQVAEVYRDEHVKQTLRTWWGDEAINPDGQVNRRFIAARVFEDETQRRRLEQLIHPAVDVARRHAMAEAAKDAKIKAFVLDTPLLFEVSLNLQCDAVVFVDAPPQLRLKRVQSTRNWDAAELLRREKSQWPLDKKQQISDYIVRNTADVGYARGQVKDVLSRILLKAQRRV